MIHLSRLVDVAGIGLHLLVEGVELLLGEPASLARHDADGAESRDEDGEEHRRRGSLDPPHHREAGNLHDGELLDNTAIEPLREPNNPSMANQWRFSKCRCCGQPLPGGGAIVGEGEPIDWFDEIIESKKRGGEISNFLWNLYNPKNREDAEGGIDAILRLKKRRSFFGGEVRISRRPLSNGRTVEITMRHISQAKLADRFVEFVSESDIGRVTDGKDPQFPFIWRPSWIQPDGDTEGYWEIVFRHTYQD